MKPSRKHALLGLVTLASTLASTFAAAPAASSSWLPGGTVRLDVGDGSLEVSVVPDRGGALRMASDGGNRWRFQGSTADLVGESYSVVLRNHTGERIKVVVGVDGLNVYGREEVAGRSDADVGSILSPWNDRTLRGWQEGEDRAQRFVFSPPEWSEGEGRTDSQIGLLTVQVYREWRRPEWDYRDREGAARAPSAEPAPRRQGDEAQAPGVESRAQAARPPIGTTAGEDVESNVRTVRFVAATTHPEAWAVIDYGQTRRARHDDRGDWYDRRDLLGLALEETRDGARIVGVAPGSPADRAGLEPWDVIVRLDTVQRPTVAVARRILLGKERGDYSFLRVRRGDHELAVKIRG